MKRKRKKMMSYILVDESEVDGEYDKSQEMMIVNSARQLREDMKGIWGDESYSNSEKRERTIDLRNKWIADIQQTEFSDKTIYHILAHLEESYSDIRRHLFLLMIDKENYRMRRNVYNIIQDSSMPVFLLRECSDGEIRIYDYTFRKEFVPMPYDDQDEFRDYVSNFMKEYGVQANWFASKISYDPRNFSSFLNGKKNLSKSKRIEVYRKIVEYRDRLANF